jgi:hypothetical protein
MLGLLPNLRTLTYRDWACGDVAPGLFALHPNLQVARTQRLHAAEVLWQRAGSETPGH